MCECLKSFRVSHNVMPADSLTACHRSGRYLRSVSDSLIALSISDKFRTNRIWRTAPAQHPLPSTSCKARAKDGSVCFGRERLGWP